MSALIGSRAVAIPVPGGIRSESRRPGLVALLGVLAAIWVALSQVGALPSIPIEVTRAGDAAAERTDGKPERPGAGGTAKARQAFGQLPVSFIPNRGQLDGEVSYHAAGSRESFYFAPDKAVLAFQEGFGESGLAEDGMGLALALRFLGANPDVAISGAARKQGVVNYLIGDDPSRWQTGLPTFGEVVYRDLWPGIDMAFRGEAGRLKYEFVVHPGANPAGIRLAYRGAQWLTVAPSGDLVIQTQLGNLRDTRPVTYQAIGSRRVAVESRFVVRRGVGYGFTLGDYDRRRPLVIDPGLVYSTFLGGSGRDVGNDVAVDASGSAYVTGETESTNFPTTTGAFDTTQNGFQDAFVTKLNPAGTGVLYSTFLGGNNSDGGHGVAVDPSGNAYVTGLASSANFPTTTGAFDTTHNGNQDAFVTKLNPAGTAPLLYSTFLGGNSLDQAGVLGGGGIALDASGSAYVTGRTLSTNFPTTPGAYDRTHNGNDDAFVAKVDTTRTGSSSLVYSTFLGGAAGDTGEGIALDALGSAHVTGDTESANYPTTAGAFDTTQNGSRDAFVTKLNANGSNLVYSTFLGGSGFDRGFDLAVDASGASVAGQTTSTNYPTTTGSFDTTHNGNTDAFVTKLNPTGTAPLLYSTFLGGTAIDHGLGITLDSSGSAYVTGSTSSTDYPTTVGAYDTTHNGSSDAFVTRLNPTGTAPLLYSTFLGGGVADSGEGIAVDASGSAYVAGQTSSTDYPTTPVAFDPTHNGNPDAFVTKLDMVANPPVPNSIALSPATDTNPAGTQHCVTATVRDQFNNTMSGVSVVFTVMGANPQPAATRTTNASGEAQFCYTGTAVGTDTIRAFADTNGNGSQDAGEPSGTATKVWVAGTPANVTLRPETDSNPTGTEHCVTATVTDASNNPVPNATVIFSVTGANGRPATSRTTDNVGEAEFCYTGTRVGPDTINAFVDNNGNGSQDAGEPFDTATKTWVPATAATVTVEPATDSNPAGTQHCVTATVEDASGNPVPGVKVFFTVSGTHTDSGSDTTGAQGQATFCYTGTRVGADTITAVADADADGTPETGEPAGTATKTWSPGTAATVTVSPETDTNPAGAGHCVTATVEDAFGNPVPDVQVFFTVTGANSASGTRTTDANGQAAFCYTGTNAGTDTIRAVADANGNGQEDTGEPTGIATKIYTPAQPAVLTLDPATDTNVAGTEHCVDATVTDTFGNPVPGVRVYFDVSGANTASGSATTNEFGKARFCYTGERTGTDSIEAFADTNANGGEDLGEPSGTATKVWTPARPATVTLEPTTATNRAGEEHCVTATVRDAFGNTVDSGVRVFFTVTGANSRSGSEPTDANGQAEFCYTGTNAGTDVIRAVADANDTGTEDAEDTPPAVATKVYGPAAPFSVTVTPPAGVNRAGQEHCVAATVRDQFGNPVQGVDVFFTVTGSNPDDGSDVTDENGIATFCYTGTNAGQDVIRAVADADDDGVPEGTEPAGTATKTYIPAEPATVTVQPPTAINRAGQEHCVTATVRDEFGNPVPDVEVLFEVTGANARTGSDTTDGAGQATFCYMGTTAGADTIRATADTDGDGQAELGEPFGLATKTYGPADAATVVVEPPTATNRAGEEHCVTATVRDEFGNVVPGVRVFFTVTGANTAGESETTDDAGQAVFCYTGRTAGADTITAVADSDGDGQPEAGEPTGTATKVYTPAQPASVVVTPATDANRAGEEHCVTATVRDAFGNPTPGVRVFFEVIGVNPRTGTDTTDANGEATFCYTGTMAGLDTIRATADANGNGSQDLGEPFGEATKVYTPARPATVTVEPPTATNRAGEEHCVTATVRDEFGNPTPDVEVAFEVTGANPRGPTVETTDDQGRATFCYTGTTAGEDVIRATADGDEDGQVETGEPFGAATKTYGPAAPASVTLDPPTDVNRAGEQHCVIATVRDVFGNTVPGVRVFFTVTGANASAGADTADASGRATFCYTGTTAGEDVIRATADADGDNTPEATEPTGTATKTYRPGRPAVVEMDPPAATNRAGEQHCVTATVRDEFGNPVESGVNVFFTVIGANAAAGTRTTDESGQTEFCYTGTTAGTDTIRAVADANGSGTEDAGDTPPGLATKIYGPAQPASVTVEPLTDTNRAGEEHCVTATVRDVFGNRVPGVKVFFSVAGANTASGTDTTDAAGEATFCYTGTRAGLDTIRAVADADEDNTPEATEPSGEATKTYTPAEPASVTVEPPTDLNPAGEEHCVIATVRDAFGNPTPGVRVFFTVSGANTATGADTTDASGEASFCYTGTTAGEDVIRAVADADGNNQPDTDEPSGTATKTYTPGQPATVTVEPAAATNRAGEEHCVTATVRDEFGNPTPGVRVFFTVTGANPRTGTDTTDDGGEATFCYTGTTAGEDVIRAVADANGNNQPDTGEPTGTATKTYTPAAPATVTVEPAAATNPAGEEHCVTATVTDLFGNPVPAVKVFFTVTGANSASGADTTGANGRATFCYTGTNAGVDTIRAVADANGNNQPEAGEPSGSATKTYTPGAPATVTLEPKADTNTVGDQHCVTATVRDQFGNPVPGVRVYFSVTGSPNVRDRTSGSATTNQSGQATFCYTALLPGQDTIRAFADTNGNGTEDLGEPSDTATKTWILPPSTPLCQVSISDGGRITAANGDKATFGGNAKVAGDGTPSGNQSYQDHGPALRMTVKSIDILAVTCDSDRRQASIYGTATIDGAGSHYFRIQVKDLGKNGRNDTYWILLDTGYSSGEQRLQLGNITIR
jgi:uncharacterized protein (DUF2141 family)